MKRGVTITKYNYDFAISYAGEDIDYVKPVADILSQLNYNVFFAPREEYKLIGKNGENTFEKIFSRSKQVLVFISKHYRGKKWPRFEWDIIVERDEENRYIPIRLDKTRILGLPSNIFYIDYKNHTPSKIADICVKKLIDFEKTRGIIRKTEYEKTLNAIKNKSKGITDKAFQLVKQKKKRKPLKDFILKKQSFKTSYKIIDQEPVNFSIVKRQIVRIVLPDGLSKEKVIYNLKHCCVTLFNKFKYDAIGILAYRKNDDINSFFTIGKLDFAPYGKWEEAINGVAYDLPVNSYDFNIKLREEYFKDNH